MKTFSCTLVVALAVVIASLDVIGAEVRFTCINGTMGPTPELRAKLGACYMPEVYGTTDGKKNPNCAAFCFTEAINGLKDGVPDKAAFDKLVETEFPAATQADAKTRIGFCFERHGKVDLTDEKCVDIAAFSACGTKLVATTKC